MSSPPTTAAPPALTAPTTVVLGAGPHALTLVLLLLETHPEQREHLTVVDPAGRWLDRWDDAFERFDIATLRSPGVHHPHPDPGALEHFARCRDLPGTGLPYGIPSTIAFRTFCRDLIERHDLEGLVERGRAVGLERDGRAVRVVLEHRALTADRVVVANDPHRRTLPPWVAALPPLPVHQLAHSADVDLRTAVLDGEHIGVVGGGLTAAHLALGAVKRGATVTWLTRRPVTERMFDVEPGWLGPLQLEGFHAEPDPHRRRAMATAARGGGSVPPWIVPAIEQARAAGRLSTASTAGITGGTLDGGRLTLAGTDVTVAPLDRLWLATGTTADLAGARALHAVCHDTPTVEGLPVTGPDLRLGPWPVHVMGRLATLALGPAAGNLWGARQGARAIVSSLRAPALRR